jgi:hypothetical protein
MINYSLGAKFNLSSFFSNHTVLRLPPYHCIFNPKENIWGTHWSGKCGIGTSDARLGNFSLVLGIFLTKREKEIFFNILGIFVICNKNLKILQFFFTLSNDCKIFAQL